jgi:putative transposase
MKGTGFSEEQIIGVLREHKAGAKTEEVCRRHGISSATFYKWKSKYGGLEVSDAKRLKALEDENRRLKRLLADSMLDNAALKDLLGKTFKACGATSSSGQSDGASRAESGACVRVGGVGSVDPALPVQATRGRGNKGTAAGAGRGAAAFRSPAPGVDAGARRSADEPQEALPDIPRGAAHGAPAQRAQAGVGHSGVGYSGAPMALPSRINQRWSLDFVYRTR